MTTTERLTLLVNFLEDEGVFSEYVRNVGGCPTPNYSPLNDSAVDYIKRLCESTDYESVFTRAFNWSQTVEGSGYWSQLLFKWRTKFE